MHKLSDISAKHGLDVDSSIEEVRRNLRIKLSDLHPDKTGGSFKSDADKNEYFELKQALEKVDEIDLQSKSVIPVSQLPALIDALSAAMQRDGIRSSESLHTAAVADMRTRISRTYSAPKIGSGAFAAISVFLFGAAGSLKDNPILGPLVANQGGQVGLLVLAIVSGMFFASTWLQERKIESMAEYLMSERALMPIFYRIADMAKRTNSPTRISSEQILDVVAEFYDKTQSPIFLPGAGRRSFDLSTIEKAAELQTQRLMERGVITRAPIKSLLNWYDIVSAA